MEKEKELEQKERSLIESLQASGRYASSLQPMITKTAGDMLVYEKLLEITLKADDLILVELSREGNDRFSAHPVLERFFKASEVLGKDLAQLTLNVKDSSKLGGSGESGVDALMERINNIKNK